MFGILPGRQRRPSTTLVTTANNDKNQTIYREKKAEKGEIILVKLQQYSVAGSKLPVRITTCEPFQREPFILLPVSSVDSVQALLSDSKHKF